MDFCSAIVCFLGLYLMNIAEISTQRALTTNLTCDVSDDVYAREPADDCLYHICRASDKIAGKLYCPAGKSVSDDYISGKEFPCTQGSTSCLTCDVPSAYTSPRQWMHGYVYDLPVSSPYFRQHFTDTKSTVTLLGPVDFLCVGTESDGDIRYGVRMKLMMDGDAGFLEDELFYQCVELRFINHDLILQKQGALVSTKPSVQACRDVILPTIPWYRILLEFADGVDIFQPPAVTCPFPEGTYHVTMDLSENQTRVCEGSNSSTAVVTGENVTFRLCTPEHYRPMVCHQSFSAQDLGEADSDNGDVVIMSHVPDEYRPHALFFCVRYRVTWNKVYLGMTESTPNSLDCAKGATYRTYGEFVPDVHKAYAFELTAEDISTAPTTVMTTVDITRQTTSTETPSTTNDPVLTTFVQTTYFPHSEEVTEEATSTRTMSTEEPGPTTNTADDLSSTTTIVISVASIVAILVLVAIVTTMVMRYRDRDAAQNPSWLLTRAEKPHVDGLTHVDHVYDSVIPIGSTLTIASPATMINNGSFKDKLQRYEHVGRTPSTRGSLA